MDVSKIYFSILSCLIFTQQTMRIFALILRLPCKTTAEFNVIISNKALKAFVIEELPHLHLAECKMQCLLNEKCKSINYQAQGNQLCQLNSKTSEDSQDADAVLQDENGWTFLSTNYTSTMVGDTCERQSPCGNELCKDTCDCPGYHCHTCKSNEIGLHCTEVFSDCESIPTTKGVQSGVYFITPNPKSLEVKPVYCDVEAATRGWLVIQRRLDNSTNFDRPWSDYEIGFGILSGNYWIGLHMLYILTTGRNAMLRIEIRHREEPDVTYFAEYSSFSVANADSNYELTISGYNANSTAGDGMTSLLPDKRFYANGMQFTTKDRDNDLFHANCAVNFAGAWWHRHCFAGNLNNFYPDLSKPMDCEEFEIMPRYMSWFPLKDCYGGIIFSEMKIRYL